MEIIVTTRLEDGVHFKVDIHIEDMDARSLRHLDAEEIRAMVEPQARFILNHLKDIGNDEAISRLSHCLVYGVNDTQSSVQEGDKEASDPECCP